MRTEHYRNYCASKGVGFFAVLLVLAVSAAAAQQPAGPALAPAGSEGASREKPAENVNEGTSKGNSSVSAAQKSVQPPGGTDTPDKKPAAGKELSLAERIARLERARDADRKRLVAMKKRLAEQEEEYAKANAEFKQVDDVMEKWKKAIREAEESGDAARLEKLKAGVGEVEKKRKLAQERFDLAIEARQTTQDQMKSFQEKIDKEEKALAKLTKPAAPGGDGSLVATQPSGQTPGPKTGPAKNSAAVAEIKPPPADAPAQNVLRPSASPVAKEETPEGKVSGNKDEAGAVKVLSLNPLANHQEVERARAEAAEKEAAAKQAKEGVSRIKGRLQNWETIIAREKKALENAQKRAANEEQTLKTHQEDLQKLQKEGGTPAAVDTLNRRIHETRQRLERAQEEARDHAAQLKEYEEDHAALLALKGAVEGQAEEKEREAAAAEQNLAAMQDPFAPQNLLLWIKERGPRILFIFLAVIAVQILIKQLAKRIVAFLSRGDAQKSQSDREKRANTLVGVFHNTSIIVLYVSAALIVLEVVGIPIAPLLGGAAVVGLAVAFASQNLIKDYFYGFMILMEDQYGVNDVVTIEGITGQVERITLRVTVIRDMDAVHFIPHGQITTVSNLTYKWSRAVFEIGVAYKENVDRVMEVLVQLGRDLRQDPAFRRDILDDPEMLGVDALADSAVVVKFFIKTRPLRQWPVKREMLRRIKNKFDELGIEIPFPHRTLYHRCEEGKAIPVRQMD